MKLMITLLFVSFSCFGQDTEWQQSLKKEIHKLDTSKNYTVWIQSIDKLESLTKAHPNEWLLQYYTGWACTQPSFQAPKGEADPLTDRAEPYVKKALELQPDNTETL